MVHHGGGGEEPPPSPFTNEIFSSSSSHHSNRHHKNTSKKPFSKLDVKFDFPTYNGEHNAEKLNSWIRKIEFYFWIQQIAEDDE